MQASIDNAWQWLEDDRISFELKVFDSDYEFLLDTEEGSE